MDVAKPGPGAVSRYGKHELVLLVPFRHSRVACLAYLYSI